MQQISYEYFLKLYKKLCIILISKRWTSSNFSCHNTEMSYASYYCDGISYFMYKFYETHAFKNCAVVYVICQNRRMCHCFPLQIVVQTKTDLERQGDELRMSGDDCSSLITI